MAAKKALTLTLTREIPPATQATRRIDSSVGLFKIFSSERRLLTGRKALYMNRVTELMLPLFYFLNLKNQYTMAEYKGAVDIIRKTFR